MATIEWSIATTYVKPIEFSGQILRIAVGTNVYKEDEYGRLLPYPLPLLIRVRVDHADKLIHIVEMCKASQEKLAETKQRAGLRRWQRSPWMLSQPAAEEVLRQIQMAPEVDALTTLNGRDALPDAIQQGLLRKGDARPARLWPQLWRATISRAGRGRAGQAARKPDPRCAARYR